MADCGPFILCVITLCFLVGNYSATPYLGKFIDKLSQLHHGVSGEVYAVDERTIHIKDFTYDGQGPGAYFYANTRRAADKGGFRLRDENGKGDVIRKYNKEGVTLTLPNKKTLNDIKIFYVWCEDYDVNFGDVKIPEGLAYPQPVQLNALTGVHGISSTKIVVVDAQTLLIENLTYDGQAPDAKFWAGQGTKPSPQGFRIPDENGEVAPLKRYDGQTIVLTLPGNRTIFDIGHFGIWCEQFTVDFGHIIIPQYLNAPPSLKMLGVSPQKLQHSINIPSKVSHPKFPIGGHLQPTTFRPPRFFRFNTRRTDQEISKQNIQHSEQPQLLIHQQSQEPQYLIQRPQPQVFQSQPQTVFSPSRLYQQPLVHLPHSVQLQLSNQIPREPIIQHQLIYLNQQPYYLVNPHQVDSNSYHQARRVQDDQLGEQLPRQYNRFNIISNQNIHVPLG